MPCRPSWSSYKPLKTFTDGEELIRSGLVDAVIIATPHYQHTTLGIAALKQGVHVMVEKPISAHKADAERLDRRTRRATPPWFSRACSNCAPSRVT